MLIVNGDMAEIFEMGQGFGKIWCQQDIGSNFQQLKEMLMVNGDMAEIFEMGQGFGKIWSRQHSISNFRHLKEMLKGQRRYGRYLRDGTGISRDLISTP
jgi:hypothetical protein